MSVTSPDPSVPLAEDPWREVAGLFGSIGASLAVTIPCEVEIELHRRAREVGDLPEGMIVAERFFAESQAQKTIEIAHRAINLGFRSIALRSDWKALFPKSGGQVPDLDAAFSNHRSAWITFSKGAAQKLARICDQLGHPSAEGLARCMVDFAESGEWADVEERRGIDFHRLRLESNVLLGVDADSSLARDVRDHSGKVVGKAYGAGARTYSAGPAVDRGVADVASRAMRALAERLDDFATAFLALVEPASQGAHSWSIESEQFSHHIRDWNDDMCGCCAPAEATGD